MAKKKKTREQKILADQRHVLYHLETSAQVSHPTEKKSVYQAVTLPQVPAQQSSTTYAYVLSDIRRTAFITVSIISAQLILFFLTHRI